MGTKMSREFIYSRLAEKLAEVARQHGLLHRWHKPPFRIRRTRAGYWQKAAGAFSFVLEDSEFNLVFGSCDRAKEVLKAHNEKKLSYLNEYGTDTLIVELKEVE